MNFKKGDLLKCVDNKDSDYLTTGKVYAVNAGEGDRGVFGFIGNDEGFEIIDDEGESIYQYALSGLHGDFEVENA